MTLRRSALISLAGQLISVVVSVASVPPLLRLIGDARYGVLLVVWVLLGYFTLFDLGVGQATTQRIAKLKDATPSARSDLLWTALVMNLAMGVVGGVILLPAGYVVLGRFVSMDPLLRAESLRALPWMALGLLFNMAASVFNGSLQGREAFRARVFSNTVGLICAQGFPLLTAWLYSNSLEWLVAGVTAARGVSLAMLVSLCKRIVPWVGRPHYSKVEARSLISYGGWITVSSIVGPLMSTFDRIVISAISGAEAVTYYGVPQGLVGRLLMLPSSVSTVLLPRFAASAQQTREALTYTSVRVVSAVMTPMVVAGQFAIGPILTVWISPSFAEKATLISQVLIVGVWFNGMALVAHSNVLAKGRPDLVAKMHVVELPAYLGLLWLFLWLWGPLGAALAWTVRVTVDAILLYRVGGLLNLCARPQAGPVALVAIAFLGTRLESNAPSFTLMLGALLTTLAVIASHEMLPKSLRPAVLVRPAKDSTNA